MTTKFIMLNVWNTENIKVKVNQGEVNARFLQVQFIDKNQALDLENKQVFFFAKKPDGNLIFNRCEILDAKDGTIYLALTSQMSIVDGIMEDCEFDIIALDLARLKVKGLILEIEKCTDFDSATESTSEFTALEEAIAGYQEASDTIDAHVADKNNPHEVTATQVGAAESIHTHSTNDITSGTLPIARGGTNAASASTALSNLGGVPTTRTINSKALSSNITLGVTDIGAASYEVKSSTDFNDVKTPGLYSMRTSTTNAPTSGSYHSLIVNKSDNGDFIQQIAVKESTYEIYIRYYNSSSWSSWKRFSMDGHSHATSDITSGTLPINRGGTNATSASTALSNLGAVPTTRTINSKALSSDITLGVTDIGAASYEVKYEEDFNHMKTPGLYTMVVGSNKPTENMCHSLIVNRSYDQNDFVQQIAIEESTYEVYMRYCSDTSWSNWKKFSMDGHSHATSDITSGTLPINRGGTGATTASTALSNLGAVKFSNVVQQKIYIPNQPEVPGSGFKIISLTNPFKGNTTDKILGITSYNISGRFEPDATGDRCVMYLNSPCPFDNTSSLGSIMVYNSYGRSLYVTTDSYIVVTSLKP